MSHGNINELSVVSEHREKLDENGDAEHLYIHGGITDEMRFRNARRDL